MMFNDSENIKNSSVTNSSSLEEPSTHIQKLALACLFSVVIVIVIIGNTLVILAVITTKRLRTVTNCFVMSLAVADWFVGVFVMPPAVANAIMGKWELGWILCDIWVYLDILLCTASILSLCAISVDRYLAVTQPLSYSRRRRSKRLAFTMILIVWISSALITCPPMLGWYDKDRHVKEDCTYNKNTGYVIFSAMGSFFIPMIVMLYVYVRISCVVAQRHDQLAHIDTHSRKSQKLVISVKEESDIDRGSSEGEEPNLRCGSGQSAEPLQQQQPLEQRKSLGARSIRSTLSFSFNNDTLSTTRSVSLYKPAPFNPQRSRPESLNFDATILNLDSATRVSSFRRETKTAQTLSIVMGGFIACWLPFFIFYLLTPFLETNNVNSLIMLYLTWLGWFNSAINPFIYAFYSPDFRIAFWRLTIKHFSKSRRADFAFQHK